ADDVRAAVVEGEEGDAARQKGAGEEVGAARLEDRRAAGAVQPEQRARRSRLEEQTGQRDAVGRLEPHEAAGWLTIRRRSPSHRHNLSRLRYAPPSQKPALFNSTKSTFASS